MKLGQIPWAAVLLCLLIRTSIATAADSPEIRTPKPSAAPRINGPSIYGARPRSPFLYRIPATGDRPMKFSARALPRELKLDSATGQITGSMKRAGEHVVILRAENGKGA